MRRRIVMNVRKHLAGLALFSVILGSAIFINHFLNIPNATIPSVPLQLPLSVTKEKSPPVDYEVGQVLLDFINKKSYTELTLKRQPGQPSPEKLWVTTYYFSPDYASGRWWTSQTEISQPFAKGDQINLVTASSCDLCSSSDTPRVGYFARVYVSTEYADKSYPPDARFNRDITTATPVVIRWPDDKRQSAGTIDKFVRGPHQIF
jgi:hypothetical protein